MGLHQSDGDIQPVFFFRAAESIAGFADTGTGPEENFLETTPLARWLPAPISVMHPDWGGYPSLRHILSSLIGLQLTIEFQIQFQYVHPRFAEDAEPTLLGELQRQGQ